MSDDNLGRVVALFTPSTGEIVMRTFALLKDRSFTKEVRSHS